LYGSIQDRCGRISILLQWLWQSLTERRALELISLINFLNISTAFVSLSVKHQKIIEFLHPPSHRTTWVQISAFITMTVVGVGGRRLVCVASRCVADTSMSIAIRLQERTVGHWDYRLLGHQWATVWPLLPLMHN